MKKKFKGYKIKIKQDVNAETPRFDDNVGKMVCFHNRYTLGDVGHGYIRTDYGSWDELREAIEEKENVHTILPIFMLDHSGVTISTKPFSCPWDSGQIGFIYATKEKLYEEKIEEHYVDGLLEGEIETYDQYLRDEVYGYIIKKDGEEVESCWGFYGKDYCLQEAESCINNILDNKNIVVT